MSEPMLDFFLQRLKPNMNMWAGPGPEEHAQAVAELAALRQRCEEAERQRDAALELLRYDVGRTTEYDRFDITNPAVRERIAKTMEFMNKLDPPGGE